MAKKSLGQNFLKQSSYIKKIIDVANPTPDQITLEIGPGKGALTKELLARGARVVAVETDRTLIPYLEEIFARSRREEKLEIIHDDILVFDETSLKKYNKPYCIVANIPYYITGAIFEKFLSSSYQPTSMTLIVQKEVADRIMMRDGKGSILAMSIHAYGTPHSGGKIPARYFSPTPQVDSAILRIDTISKARFASCSEKDFFAIVKAGFAHKRKMLLSNLKGTFPHIVWEDIFSEMSISPTVRAEELSVDMWIALAKASTDAL